MRRDRSGLTLVELTVSIAVMGIIATVITALLVTGLDAYRSGMALTEVHREAAYAMNQMVHYTRNAAFVFIPNGRLSDTDVLAVAAGIDTDGDGLIDEDVPADMNGDGHSGLHGYDHDGDGSIDEGNKDDDDEDGLVDEEILNGIDDDGDGSIDEDLDADMNQDAQSGIAGYDDDNDGEIDEEPASDDDEDGQKNKDPAEAVIFFLASNTLFMNHPAFGPNALSENVAEFRAQYVFPANSDPYIDITLALDNGAGSAITLNRQVYPANITQKHGMTVKAWPFGELTQYTLTLNVAGEGAVGQDPAPPYYENDFVTLTAVPSGEGWHFNGWSGNFPAGHETDNPLLLTIDGDKMITATFVPN